MMNEEYSAFNIHAIKFYLKKSQTYALYSVFKIYLRHLNKTILSTPQIYIVSHYPNTGMNE